MRVVELLGVHPDSNDLSHPLRIDVSQAMGVGRWRLGRAYRAGQLVCGCVQVGLRVDDRLGLTWRERRTMLLRFHEPVADDLRAELTALVRRSGAAAERAAERADPIELVIDDPSGELERMTGWLRPPHRRHGWLRDIEFGFGQLARIG